MQIAVLGTGAIGSAFAYQLARAGHVVTAIARGERLAQLQRDGAIVLVSGERAAVQVAARLDQGVPYDLVIVSVLATQVGGVLDDLSKSEARQVMFMFNTFESLAPLRQAVGDARFSFGFPGGVSAHLVDGRLKYRLLPGTTAGSPEWAKVFGAAGISTATSDDMQGWLRSHAAFVIPLMAIGVAVLKRGTGLTWGEARDYAEAMDEAFTVVRSLGHRVSPAPVAALARLPRAVTTALLWLLSRSQVLRDLGALGSQESRTLIDMVGRVWRQPIPALVKIRPPT